MGAWGIGSFENDTAIDFLSTFEDEKSFSLLRRAIEDCVSDDYLELDIIHEGIAALEIIAAINGNPCEDFPELEKLTLEGIQEEFEPKITKFILELCEDALSIIEREEDNEFMELIEEQNLSDELVDILADLRERII